MFAKYNYLFGKEIKLGACCENVIFSLLNCSYIIIISRRD